MNYLDVLRADLEKGYSKADLERLIGLPKNNLSGVLKGDKKLSRKSELKIELWEASEKPNPLELKYQNRIEDLAAGRLTGVDMEKMKRMSIEFTKPMHEKARNAVVNDILNVGIAITKSDTDSNIERIDPLSEEGQRVMGKATLIAQYEEEIKTLGDSSIANQRKKWLKNKIYELKYKT